MLTFKNVKPFTAQHGMRLNLNTLANDKPFLTPDRVCRGLLYYVLFLLLLVISSCFGDTPKRALYIR